MKNNFQKMGRSHKWILGILLFSGAFAISAGVGSNLFEISKNLDIYSSIYRELNTYYVDDIDPNKVMRSGIDAMLSGLDPYTNYISEAEMEGHRFQMTGRYGGIGAVVRKIDGQIVVAEPYEGFAAHKSGLQAGDIILSIDGKSTEGKSTNQISDILRGSPGTEVKLGIERPYAKPNKLSISLDRQEIKIKNVPYYGMASDGIGYIRLTQFTEKSGQHVGEALLALQSENGPLKGVILDLRSNPGGLLREAVNVSNVFIPKGEMIVSTRGKVKDWDRTFNSLNVAVDSEIPLAILIDRSSASASEIVAGVVQDLDRGVVIGERSFGKGLVQTTRDLPYKTKIKLTTAKYYTPSGRCIQAIDYSHRNEDGSVGKIPDSLKNEFHTKAGRLVYDGGGIEPDVLVEPQEFSLISLALLRNNLIFNYATLYHHQNKEIPDAADFEISQKAYDVFINWLDSNTYEYATMSEKLLDELSQTAEKEKYKDAISDDLSEMREKLHADKTRDLHKFAPEIREELSQEIVTRYYYQTGTIENSFKRDSALQQAIVLFDNMDDYHNLLQH